MIIIYCMTIIYIVSPTFLEMMKRKLWNVPVTELPIGMICDITELDHFVYNYSHQ